MNKSHALDQNMKIYLLEAIASGYEGRPTNEQLINLAKYRLNVEMGWRIDQVGRAKAAQDWLEGLAINIDFYNYDICQLMLEWEALNENFTEEEGEAAVARYWAMLPNKLLQLFDGYRVPKKEINEHEL